MFNRMILAALALAAASPALAQNDAESAPGRLTEWEDAAPVAPPSRAVVFTAAGTYGDLPEVRLIDVLSDADSDGDGAKDKGVLRVTCNGGDTLSGVFNLGGTSAAGDGGRKPKPATAADTSALAPGKTFKGRWAAGASGAAKPVTVAAGGADICAGLG